MENHNSDRFSLCSTSPWNRSTHFFVARMYWSALSMIIIVCLLLQCKLVWIKQQLVPRLPSELQSSARRSVHIVASPVYMDQTTIGKKEFSLADYIPAWCPTSIAKEIKHHTKVRPGNKHERLFWFSSMGPEI